MRSVIAGLVVAAGLASVAGAQLQLVTSIPGSFTDITGKSLRIMPSTEYQDNAPFTLGPSVANVAFPAGDIFVSTLGTLGYAVSPDLHNVNGPLPSPTLYGGGRAAAVLWDDLRHLAPGAGVYAAQVMENAVPVQIFEWVQLDHSPTSPGRVTFEIKIYGGGRGPGGALAQYIYQSMSFGDP